MVSCVSFQRDILLLVKVIIKLSVFSKKHEGDLAKLFVIFVTENSSLLNGGKLKFQNVQDKFFQKPSTHF